MCTIWALTDPHRALEGQGNPCSPVLPTIITATKHIRDSSMELHIILVNTCVVTFQPVTLDEAKVKYLTIGIGGHDFHRDTIGNSLTIGINFPIWIGGVKNKFNPITNGNSMCEGFLWPE